MTPVPMSMRDVRAPTAASNGSGIELAGEVVDAEVGPVGPGISSTATASSMLWSETHPQTGCRRPGIPVTEREKADALACAHTRITAAGRACSQAGQIQPDHLPRSLSSMMSTTSVQAPQR